MKAITSPCESIAFSVSFDSFHRAPHKPLVTKDIKNAPDGACLFAIKFVYLYREKT